PLLRGGPPDGRGGRELFLRQGVYGPRAVRFPGPHAPRVRFTGADVSLPDELPHLFPRVRRTACRGERTGVLTPLGGAVREGSIEVLCAPDDGGPTGGPGNPSRDADRLAGLLAEVRDTHGGFRPRRAGAGHLPAVREPGAPAAHVVPDRAGLAGGLQPGRLPRRPAPVGGAGTAAVGVRPHPLL